VGKLNLAANRKGTRQVPEGKKVIENVVRILRATRWKGFRCSWYENEEKK
jgi:hypothetical protein